MLLWTLLLLNLFPNRQEILLESLLILHHAPKHQNYQWHQALNHRNQKQLESQKRTVQLKRDELARVRGCLIWIRPQLKTHHRWNQVWTKVQSLTSFWAWLRTWMPAFRLLKGQLLRLRCHNLPTSNKCCKLSRPNKCCQIRLPSKRTAQWHVQWKDTCYSKQQKKCCKLL